MPSIAQMPVSSSVTSSTPGGKKRKREQPAYGNGDEHPKLNNIQYSYALPTSRPFLTTSSQETSPLSHQPVAPQHVLKPRSVKPLRSHDAKRLRIRAPSPSKQDSTSMLHHEMDNASSANARVHTGSTGMWTAREREAGDGYARTDLRPCHICHQKPKVRTDLDSYADCEGCGKRTCYICMRECLGPSSPAVREGRGIGSEVGGDGMSFMTEEERLRAGDGLEGRGLDAGAARELEGDRDRERGYWCGEGRGEWGHRDMICSQCCVERGADGEVRCLGCLRAEEGG